MPKAMIKFTCCGGEIVKQYVNTAKIKGSRPEAASLLH